MEETRNSLSTRMSGYRSSRNNLDNFGLQFIPNLIKCFLIPVGMYMCFKTFFLTPIKSLAAILILPTNTFYPIDAALVLISDNSLLSLPPFPPHSIYCLPEHHPTHSKIAALPI
jgi:hypothetical protein